jgi:hypothetical protein
MLVLLIAVTLIVQGLLRGWVAIDLLLSNGIEGQLGGLVHWRVFDGFAGWVALMILAMTDDTDHRARPLVRAVLALGVAAFAGSLLLGDVQNRAIVEIGVAIVLAIAGLLVAGRQVIALAHQSRTGLNIEQLWRAVAAQWVLLWVAAEVTLRVRFRKEGVESEEMARSLLFLLPVIGVGGNVLMAVGIRWWTLLRNETFPGNVRIRAWVVAMAFLNIGALLVIVGSIWARGVAVCGAALMIAAIALYLIGFPRRAWRATAGGWCVPLAFGIFIIALLLMAGELLMERTAVATLYSAAWRHLLASVELFWLIGMGSMALQRQVPARIAAGTTGIASLTRWLVLTGVLAVTAVLLLTLMDRDTIRGLFVGAVLQLAGLLLGTAATLRAARAIHPPSALAAR